MPEATDRRFELLGAETGNCLRVSVALEVLGLPYAAVPVDLRRAEHRSPAFLAINPDGRVPVLVDRSQPEAPLTLTQSNAILFHLCDLQPGALLPVEAGPARSIALERFFYFVTDVIAPNGNAFFLKHRVKAEGADHLAQRSIEAIVASERFLDDGYMAGDAFSLVDIAAVTVIRASADRLDWPSLPRLRSWFETVVTRPDVRRGLAAFASPGSNM
ncbi:glutathione S-transferase family protein [Novosphingobium sp. JCM 18896]|uniref:glutathione S-transferase family protein n=1 Tax=Novosphingobium sp. JCM 18896 TaxID=2989731 RepID=UPI002222CBF0|nr:glutathione S-transferase family protein [Novosphingobium sp. JCM 18896]MCW1431238.1 glutathione S-transferase family protein [Novosphingobium sp. JCM 18896]